MKRIVFKRPDGGVSIPKPCEPRRGFWTKEGNLEKWTSTDIAEIGEELMSKSFTLKDATYENLSRFNKWIVDTVSNIFGKSPIIAVVWATTTVKQSQREKLDNLAKKGIVQFSWFETEEDYLNRIEAKLREKCPDAKGNFVSAIPDDYVRVADLPEENIPTDREFRNAWAWTTPDPVIDIDFPKAQEITKNRLRAERKPLLEALDIETMNNITNTTKLAEIVAQKQVLKDVTKKVDDCKTLDELRALKVI